MSINNPSAAQAASPEAPHVNHAGPVLYTPYSLDAPLTTDSIRHIELKSLLKKHAGIETEEGSIEVLASRGSSLKALLAKHASNTSPNGQPQALDLSYLIDTGLNGDIAVKLMLSNSQIGMIQSIGNHQVEVEIDSQGGSFVLRGNAEEVRALLAEMRFIPNVQQLADFYLNVEVEEVETEEVQVNRVVVLYEQDSGSYVPLGRSTSAGTAVEPDIAEISYSRRPLEIADESLRDEDVNEEEHRTLYTFDSEENNDNLFSKAGKEEDSSHTNRNDLLISQTDDNSGDIENNNGNSNDSTGDSSDGDIPPPNDETPPNSNPIAVSDSYSTGIEGTLAINSWDLLSNDSDPDGDSLTLQGVALTSSGGGSIANNGDGTYIYTAPSAFVGIDSFNYIITDGQGGQALGTVYITVNSSFTLTTQINDLLIGGGGSDTFDGIAVDWHVGDQIIGNGGDDTLEITAGGVTIDTSTYTEIHSIENWDFQADAAHDITVEDSYFSRASLDDNRLDITTGSTSQGLVVDASGITNAAYSINVTATDQDDTLEGGAGNDTFTAGAGTDDIDAGGGDDRVEMTLELAAVLSPIAGLSYHLDANDTASITGHPGNVSNWNDQTANNLDGGNDNGNVVSGTDTMNGKNSLTFDGSSNLQIADDALVNTQNPQNTRSITLAFETGADVTTRQVIYEQGGGGNGYNIYIVGGNLYVGAWKSSGGAFDLFINTAITANTPYTAGFVFDWSGTNSFTGYLNGSSFGSLAPGQAQASHSGDIGIGGMSNDTRDDSGGQSGDGLFFTGEIGEILYYGTALTAAEMLQNHNYLSDKWISTLPSGDTVAGGAGTDRLALTNSSALTVNTAANTNFPGFEILDITASDYAHNFTITDDYYTAGTGVSGGTLTFDASGNSTGFTVDGSGLTGTNALSITGGDGGDTLSGGAAADTFTGGAGDDSIDAGDGDDLVNAGLLGDDTLSGGIGTDTISFANAASAINANLTSGTITGVGTKSASNFEKLIGSDYNDTLNGSYDTETIQGGAGDDTIVGASVGSGSIPAGSLVVNLDASVTGSLTSYPGTVTSWNDQSTANNDASNDTGTTTTGATTINGINSVNFDGSSLLGISDSGNLNTQNATQYSVFITFETGADITTRQVVYEQGGGTHGFNIYILNGEIYTGAWNSGGGTFRIFDSNTISTNETHTVGFVFDSIAGNMTSYLDGVEYASSAVSVSQSSHTGDIGIGGVNQASFFDDTGSENGDGVHRFTGEVGQLIIHNTALTGTDLTDLQDYLISKWHQFPGDVLQGQAGADRITGFEGDDSITGGTDIDTMTGGNGDDIFIFDTVTDSGTGASNRDVIMDFKQSGDADTIDLTAFALGGGAFIGNAAFSNAPQVRWEQVAADTVVQIDVDGNGAADFEILLENYVGAGLVAGDFDF